MGFTHYQAAQLTTVGKRISTMLYDFYLDFKNLEDHFSDLPFRGTKGTTGTQASYLELFEGDHSKVKELDKRVAEIMGFTSTVPVCGQTYSRKIDYQIVSMLSGIAQSAHKMAGDIRHLMNLKELDEPFGKNKSDQVPWLINKTPCGASAFVHLPGL